MSKTNGKIQISSKQLLVHKESMKAKSRDDRLVEHLKQAEHHVIAALELFLEPSDPFRRAGYYKRLISAQEAITGLYREELVRVRGLVRPKKGK